MNEDIALIERRLTVDEYQSLRAAVGWPEVDPAAVERGLCGDVYCVCALYRGKIIGCGRVVGDGGIYHYLQDVIVLPEYQGRGIGTRLMERIMAFVARTSGRNTFVGLMAAAGVERFYQRYGFERRADDRPGMFRLWS